MATAKTARRPSTKQDQQPTQEQLQRDYDEIWQMLRNPPPGADLKALNEKFRELRRRVNGGA